MNSNNMRSISLSSLAVSVSAAALLGVSGVAKGDTGSCHYGNSCEQTLPNWQGEDEGYITYLGFCQWNNAPGYDPGTFEDCGCYYTMVGITNWGYQGGEGGGTYWTLGYGWLPDDGDCWY